MQGWVLKLLASLLPLLELLGSIEAFGLQKHSNGVWGLEYTETWKISQ
jgi:hypothetical protein